MEAGAAAAAAALGYEPAILTASLDCEAKDAGAKLGRLARDHAGNGKPLCFIAGGETVVKLTGKGKGGRNQELALAAAEEIAGLDNVLVFSLGSDGTDGPTDAAGGICDQDTKKLLGKIGIEIKDVLADNDARASSWFLPPSPWPARCTTVSPPAMNARDFSLS